jgi:hypothetical protein
VSINLLVKLLLKYQATSFKAEMSPLDLIILAGDKIVLNWLDITLFDFDNIARILGR